MEVEVIRNLYVEQLKGNIARLEREYGHTLNLSPAIKKLGLVEPNLSLHSPMCQDSCHPLYYLLTITLGR